MLWQVAAKFNNIDDPKNPFWLTMITDGDTKEDATFHVAERIANQEPLALSLVQIVVDLNGKGCSILSHTYWLDRRSA